MKELAPEMIEDFVIVLPALALKFPHKSYYFRPLWHAPQQNGEIVSCVKSKSVPLPSPRKEEGPTMTTCSLEEGGMAADRDREEEDIMTICSAMAGGGSKVCCRRDDDLRYDPGRRKRKRAKSQKMKYRAQHQTG